MSSPVEAEKRILESDTASESTLVTKRRKIEADTSPGSNSDAANPRVDPSELASAFALASLASLSPNSLKTTSAAINCSDEKETSKAVTIAPSFEETRSPKADQAPTSPEHRLPESPKSTVDPVTPDDRTTSEDSIDRQVHFAPGTKEQQQHMSPPSILRSRMVSRRLLPIMSQQQQQQRQGPPGGGAPPLPRGMYGPGNGAYVRSPPPPPFPMHHGYHHSPSPPHWYSPHHHQAAAAVARMYHPQPPPRGLMQPPLVHPEGSAPKNGNQWICDYCNVASFSTYEEACIHEEACKKRHATLPTTTTSTPKEGASNPAEGDANTSTTVKGHSGCMKLAIPESDCEWLSELNSFVRLYCVEAFSATEEDVARSSKRGRIALNQVGVRCCFCAKLPMKDREIAAVSFPTAIGGIYESVKRWQRVHLEVCESVPPAVSQKLASLASTNVWVPTTRQYWADSAAALGLVDTHDGIRFAMDPAKKQVAPEFHIQGRFRSNHPALPSMVAPRVQALMGAMPPPGGRMTHSLGVVPHHQINVDGTTGGHVVFPEDIEMIPPYVYFLMRQVEPCRFTEADRFVARSKGPVGYPGFQCRHCNGHAGLGKYFPVSSKSLSTNSTSQNIHAHLLKCRKCPEQVKDQLVQLKIEKSRSPRLEPGWRKVFFDKVWERLHGSPWKHPSNRTK